MESGPGLERWGLKRNFVATRTRFPVFIAASDHEMGLEVLTARYSNPTSKSVWNGIRVEGRQQV